ncbi:DUF1799 domain-containing protein [Thauera butanivorans]|uniref:DUF1799 domain-containing protein n=1 Tax=Thauera butanivorans TaxID=86174 RepID=UPI003AB6A956
MYAHNWPAFQLWCLVWRQWRWVSGGLGAQRVGLDWCQVESVMRLQGIKRRRRAALMRDLKVMEDAAADELAQIDQARGA